MLTKAGLQILLLLDLEGNKIKSTDLILYIFVNKTEDWALATIRGRIPLLLLGIKL